MPYEAQVSNASRLGATRIADPLGCEATVKKGGFCIGLLNTTVVLYACHKYFDFPPACQSRQTIGLVIMVTFGNYKKCLELLVTLCTCFGPARGTIQISNFQLDGNFTTSTYMVGRPSKGFISYSVCLRMYLLYLRGVYQAVFTYGNSVSPDFIYIGKLFDYQSTHMYRCYLLSSFQFSTCLGNHSMMPV